MEDRRLPVLVAHADWSCDPKKRWMAVSRRVRGTYEMEIPEPVGDTGSLLSCLRQRSNAGGPIIVGFDFPIGLPYSYASRARITRFLDVLPLLGTGLWKNFYDIAEMARDISLYRPFYPFRPGGTSRGQLSSALGVANFQELLRTCERADAFRGNACPLFWTLGGQQVGRAAIAGWREVIVPALKDSPDTVSIWPFHGDLKNLLQEKGCVIVETYPAEACLHLGLKPPGKGYNKRRQEDRRRQAAILLAHAERRGLLLSNKLRTEIRDGFGYEKEGEDRFDAIIGLMSMIEVVLGYRTEDLPPTSEVRNIEGWILGQSEKNRGANLYP